MGDLSAAQLRQRREAAKHAGRKPSAMRAKVVKRPRGPQGGAVAAGESRERVALTPEIAARVTALAANVAGYDPARESEGFRFDVARAWKVLSFFPAELVHVKGEFAGKPFELADWQVSVLANAFGWVDAEGFRRYRQVFVYIPAKNGKTALAGGLVCYLLAEDGEGGAEIYSAACSQEQAGQVFQHAAGMVKRSPNLSAKLKVYGLTGGSTLKSIMYDDTLSFYKALAAKVNTADGANVHAAMIDELHRHPNGDLADILTKGTAARRQPLVFYLTTADSDRPSVCNEMRDFAEAVRDGKISSPRFLPVIYEAPKTAKWDAIETWRACNPNFGVTVREDYLRGLADKAKTNPRLLTLFRRLHLNQRVETSVDWLSLVQWDAGAALAEGEDAAAWRARMLVELRGQPCLAALDLASTKDMAALALWFPRPDGKAIVLPWYWLPTDTVEQRSPKDSSLLRGWQQTGFLQLTPGNVIDGNAIRGKIADLRREFEFKELAMDPYNGTQMATDLQTDGLAIISFRQGFLSMSPASKEFEKRVLTGRILHGANPMLRWNLGNCRIVEDGAGNIKPVKPTKDSPQRIDGIVCVIMAVGRAMVLPEAKASVYESGGITVL